MKNPSLTNNQRAFLLAPFNGDRLAALQFHRKTRGHLHLHIFKGFPDDFMMTWKDFRKQMR